MLPPERGPGAGTIDPDRLGQDLPEAERSIEVGRHDENRTRRPRTLNRRKQRGQRHSAYVRLALLRA